MLAVYVSDVTGARDFGEWLQARMSAIPLSQAKLARLAGVSDAQIYRYRTGQSRPDPETMAKLAGPLQADVEEMLRIAGHVEGETDSGDTFIVRTENPSVHRLVQMTQGKSPDEIERAIRMLEAYFDDDD